MALKTRDPVGHAFALLEALSEGGGKLNLSQLAAKVGIHKSSASRLLATLVQGGYAAWDLQTSHHVLGAKLITLAAAVLQHRGIPPLSQVVLDDLARESGETVTLSLWNHDHAVDIAMSPGLKAVRYTPQLSLRNPAHCTATGRLFLANMPDEQVERVLSGTLEAYTPKTVTDPKLVHDALQEIRRDGVALNHEEFTEGICALAAPVWRADGFLAAVIALSIPTFRFEPSRQSEYFDMLLEAARKLGPNTGN